MFEATPTPSLDCSAPPPETAAPPNENAPQPNPHSTIRNPQSLPPPPWQKISGLFPEKEAALSRSERRYALRKLFRHFEQLVRDALAEHAADPEKDERTFLWDPLETICIELGIARRKLSALTRELTGMSAIEVIDRLRAAELPQKFEAALAELLRYGVDRSPEEKEARSRLFDGRAPAGRDLGGWAAEHGFASYNRFRRGCMLALRGKTPRQLERAIVDKFGEYFGVVSALRNRVEWLANDNSFYAGIQNTGQPFTDGWAVALRERPQWLQQMRALLGLDAVLETAAAELNWPPLSPAQQAAVKRRAEIDAEEQARAQQRQQTP